MALSNYPNIRTLDFGGTRVEQNSGEVRASDPAIYT